MITQAHALFVSHGAPTFATEPGRAGTLLRTVGERIRQPRAILVISPHWMTRELIVTASARPGTIHDFGGFPEALYELKYAAPGAPQLASHVAGQLRHGGYVVELDKQRGLDHGAWVPLSHLYPQGQVPVMQLSLPVWMDAGSAWELGEALAPLGREKILIVGSGSLTHNLHEVQWDSAESESYAQEFTLWVREKVQARDRAALMDYLNEAPHARRAHPTEEHFLPLLVAMAAAGADTEVEVLEGGMSHGVLSMESYLFGAED